MPMRSVEDRREEERVRAEVSSVYEDLAARPLERACVLRTECCRFRSTGQVPYLTRGEAVVAALAVRRTGRVKLKDSDSGDCPLLDVHGRCSIYDDRPFGCRTHYCRAAGGVYPRRDVLDLIRRLEELDARLGGEGGVPLPGAVARALRLLEDGSRRGRRAQTL